MKAHCYHTCSVIQRYQTKDMFITFSIKSIHPRFRGCCFYILEINFTHYTLPCFTQVARLTLQPGERLTKYCMSPEDCQGHLWHSGLWWINSHTHRKSALLPASDSQTAQDQQMTLNVASSIASDGLAVALFRLSRGRPHNVNWLALMAHLTFTECAKGTIPYPNVAR